jgi:pimeloyl-ACP methyl ester carboxylesterase
MQRRAIDLENDDAEAESLEPPPAERLSEVRAPTLVAVGELDQPDMVDIAESLAAGIPGARHELLPGVAHLPPMERPGDFAALLQDFFDE